MTPLRQRMIDDMTLRRLHPNTQRNYIGAVERLTEYLKHAPDSASAEELRGFQKDMVEQGVSSSSLPLVLSIEGVTRLLKAAPNLTAKAALSVAYGAGLRTGEVCHLKVTDIDSERMMIRVEQGKGSRDRQAMLSPDLLELLRAWWREGRRLGKMLPGGWLFPGMDPVDPLSTRQLSRLCKVAAADAGLDRWVWMHTGHRKLSTTAIYTHVATNTLTPEFCRSFRCQSGRHVLSWKKLFRPCPMACQLIAKNLARV